MSTTIAEFINGLPKAELHLHIEGALEPEMVFALAERNRVTLPYPSVEALRAAYDFESLQAFLDLYYQATRVLLTERDFHELASAYLARARGQNIRHSEIFFDPQAHTRRGVPLCAIVEGIGTALDEASRANGPTTRLIACFLRDLDAADAMRTLESLLPWRAHIAGVGLDSAEANNPPAKFAEIFSHARGLGFRAVAHAGEEGPPAFVADALDKLGAERIDHGVRAIEDPELVARLAREHVPLTVCPLSNIRHRVYFDMSRHPVRRLIDAGVLVTINSDDPAYFGGYVNANYLAVQEAFNLTTSEPAALAKASFAASWLSQDEKEARIEEVEFYSRRLDKARAAPTGLS
jgi:adenosine deaminase